MSHSKDLTHPQNWKRTGSGCFIIICIFLCSLQATGNQIKHELKLNYSFELLDFNRTRHTVQKKY